MQLNRTDVLLKDEVCGKDIDYWWMMQTTAQITLSANKRTAILQQNGKEELVTKNNITPYVASMKVGMKLPIDLDIKALREEHINEKHS